MMLMLRRRLVCPAFYFLVHNLRSRKHSKSLIDKTGDLNDRCFLIRALYEDCYWLQIQVYADAILAFATTLFCLFVYQC